MGLRSEGWSCQHRGECCTRPEAVVVTHAEREALEQAHPLIPAEYRPHASDVRFVVLQAGPCPYHTGDRCGAYAARPMNCRRYACGRDGDEPWEPAPIPERAVWDRAFRRQLVVIQRTAQRWGRAHGWPSP